MNLLIVTQIFYPQTGGAATYYKLLSQELISKDPKINIFILTEKNSYPFQKEKLLESITIIRKFPSLFGEKRHFLKYIKYLKQNLYYFYLLNIIKKYKIGCILVHANLHMFPNFLYYILKKTKKYYPYIRLVSDVRDWHIPPKRIYQLNIYDKIIVCSENIYSYLYQYKFLKGKLVRIPVIQEKVFIEKKFQKSLLKKLGLEGPFIFYGGVIKEEKGILKLLRAFEYISKQNTKISLVLAGINKEKKSYFRRYLSLNSKIRYIGPVSRKEILHLLASSKLNINLSPIEAMPRISLEALALGTKVALPPGIPEFEKYCSQWVVKEENPFEIAQKILSLLKRKDKPYYPIYIHYPENVIPKYIDVFNS